MICHDGDGIPPEVEANPDKWEQDPDVLDTWFSSALWPFSTLGWPEETPEFKKFYPNSTMVCGHDILFFWVARMIMMGEYAFEQAPFPEVYLHSLIFGKSYWRKDDEGGIQYCDEKERVAFDLGTTPVPKDVESKWEKMSKSKGNIIDPLEIINDYGTDAMRMALCSSASQAWQIDLDRRRFEEFKNFANKIWNGARFIFMNLDEGDPLTSEQLSEGLNESLFTLEDRWILSALSKTVGDVNRSLENYQFDQAATKAYDFYWSEFCSYYLEISKPVLFGKQGTAEERKNKQKLLVILLLQALRLIHPMAPFITEELFQRVKERFSGIEHNTKADPYTEEALSALQAKACMVAPYPKVIKPEDICPKINHAFNLMGQVVYTIRNIRGEMKIPPAAETEVYIIGTDHSENYATVQANGNIIEALVRTRSLTCHVKEPQTGLASVGIVEDLKVIIPMPKEFSEKEAVRLDKEKERLEKQLERIRGQLANENFVSKAPPQLIEKTRSQLEQTESELQEVNAKLKLLK